MYDYLIVGAGLYGAVFAHEAFKSGKKCIVIEKRNHTGGNVFCENIEGVNVHKYGAHIFHTSNKIIWDYVNSFVEFNNYINSPLAIYNNELYNLPFNMNTFNKLWGVITPEEAKIKLLEQTSLTSFSEPANLEEQALSLVGKDIYEKLIKGYTEKQWGRSAKDLPAFIIKRLPVRFTYDNNYFNDKYQGIPIGGYNIIIDSLLKGTEVIINTDYYSDRDYFDKISNKIVFTGMLDEYYDNCYGQLEYRGLFFENEILDIDNFQGNAVVNYTERDIPWTRIIEHKHFEFGKQKKTVITREHPSNWKKGDEPYYPVNDVKNNQLFDKYKLLAENEKRIIFGGRLASYKYYDMHQVIEAALDCCKKEL